MGDGEVGGDVSRIIKLDNGVKVDLEFVPKIDPRKHTDSSLIYIDFQECWEAAIAKTLRTIAEKLDDAVAQIKARQR